MALHPSVEERLARLAPDQRAAATAPPGPVLCVAPAGSGKTTTLVARIAWLVATGTAPDRICAITFNKRAAEELGARLATALEPLGLPPDSVRVRTFHALGREILRSAGVAVEPLVDRVDLMRSIAPDIAPATLRRLDDAFSRIKLDLGLTAEDVALDPSPGPVAQAFLAYEAELKAMGGLDFDDLVARALRVLERDDRTLDGWRQSCSELLVDEAQDVDRSQLQLALLLAAPENRIFLVGDDDQTIYGWRLADVRRVLGLAAELPGLRRVDLETNYRCPRPVVERAVRLVEHNEERFDKAIRPGPSSSGHLVLAPDGSDEPTRIRRLIGSWPDDGGTQAVLARTNRELLPAVAVALEAEIPFRAPRVSLLFEDPRIDGLLDQAGTAAGSPLLALGRIVTRADDEAPTADAVSERDLLRALVAWAVPYADLPSLRAAVAERRARLERLRRDDARLSLATAHGTKGLEFDHVGVIGLDAGRFPSGRSIHESAEPERALQEERRLAYVAWTRAHRTLTLVYDPAAPSAFMLEAFDADELGLEPE